VSGLVERDDHLSQSQGRAKMEDKVLFQRWQGLTNCKRLGVNMSDEQSHGLQLSSIPEIRRVWHRGEWFYSVVDVIAFLTGTENPQSYWAVLKNRMKAEGYDEALRIEQLRLQAVDNRFRLTDTMNRQAILRLVQSIPSPRVEPLRQWLAEVGEERLVLQW